MLVVGALNARSVITFVQVGIIAVSLLPITVHLIPMGMHILAKKTIKSEKKP